jgi:hypothetical protein
VGTIVLSFAATRKEIPEMLALLLVLLLAILLFGIGFTAHLLWIVAVIVLALWLIGFLARGPEARWYRW